MERKEEEREMAPFNFLTLSLSPVGCGTSCAVELRPLLIREKLTTL